MNNRLGTDYTDEHGSSHMVSRSKTV